jgi:hypothetical protein
MYDTKPGFYLLAPREWDGAVPEGITEASRFDTRIAFCIPRVFMDDTDSDRAAIQDTINKVMVYPLPEYTGEQRVTDWSATPSFPAGDATSGERETQWVDPGAFFAQLGEVMAEVPAHRGEAAWYEWLRSLLQAADRDAGIADVLRAAARDADATLVAELFQFRNIGLPLPGHWSTQRNGARFGTDYLSRTAMAKANIFVNMPEETTYFYRDLDEHGERLGGSKSYSVRFPPGRLYYASDGSLTLIASASPPDEKTLRRNWLPAPAGPFSLYLRAYWPAREITAGAWTPPPLTRAH